MPSRVQLLIISPGDIADDKYFRKVNESDATQFALLYPAVPAHGTPTSLQIALFMTVLNLLLSFAVWAILWILFEVGVLIGFLFLGIVSFKLTTAQMVAEACEWLKIVSVKLLIDCGTNSRFSTDLTSVLSLACII